MIYYIADTHFGDERIMNLCNRPYSDTKSMENDMVCRWNDTVREFDTVYIIGDFAVSDEIAVSVLKRLNGSKHLILGNHDTVLDSALQKFETVTQIETITDNEKSICLCHYPLLSYKNSIYGGYHIFGHIHNNPKDIATELQRHLPRSINCGADVIGFKPRTLDELIKIKEHNYRL